MALLAFGYHKIYLGEGVDQLILVFTFIGSPIAGLLDAIKLFTMSDADFDGQYNGGA